MPALMTIELDKRERKTNVGLPDFGLEDCKLLFSLEKLKLLFSMLHFFHSVCRDSLMKGVCGSIISNMV